MEFLRALEEGVEEEDNCIEEIVSNPLEGTLEALMEGLKDAPVAFSNNVVTSTIDEVVQEELTVVPLIEMMKDAMTIVRQIDKSYISLDTKALEIASAFSKLRPEQYATIDFMRYLLSLTDSLLDTLPQGRNSNLVVLFEHFGGNCSSTKIVTNMTVQGMEEDQHETTEGEIVLSSSSSANFALKRGGSFPKVSEIQVNFLAVLANKINQQVNIMRIQKCTTRLELEELKSAPIFNPKKCREVSKASSKIVTAFSEPIVQAINAKLASLSKNAPGDNEEEEDNNNAPSPSSAKSDKENQEGGGSASKRPRIDTEHPQEDIIKITTQKQVSVVQLLPTNPFLQAGCKSTSFSCDAAKKPNTLLEEEVRSKNYFSNQR